MKRIIAICLVLVSVFSLVACTVTEDTPGTSESKADYAAHAEDADIWCALPSTQILASEAKEKYDSVRQDKIYLDAAKNDYETAQIIVSAKKDLKFTVSVSDLTHTEDAASVISAENCKVYIQKYVTISRNLQGNGAPTGRYPDAILPQANAVEYEQNIVKAGENGGAWLSYFIPANAKPGNYTGKATVDLGSEQVTVDVSLKVYDVEIPAETTSKSLFTVNTNMMSHYELDNSDEMYEKYVQFLIDHRVAPSGTAIVNRLAEEGDSDARLFAKSVWYWYEKGQRTFSPSCGTSNGFPNFEVMGEQIKEMALMSIEKNVNLSDLFIYYDYLIDEPFYITYTAETVQAHIDGFNTMLDSVVAELSSMPEFQTGFGKEVLQSVKESGLLITDYMDTEFYYHAPMQFNDGTPFTYAGQNVILCPKVDGYNTQEQRDQYNLLANKEKWWYNCNVPLYPYPSYHTDDTPVSAAMFGWMMAQYGITGNLAWCVNYMMYNNEYPEDPYAFPSFGSGANGDGTIIYPGKIYGVDGPVGSIRTEAILDGQEDYELMKWMMQEYAKCGICADDVIERVTSSVYSGSKMIGGSAEYEEARKILLSLAEACASDAKLMVSSIEKVTDAVGRETYQFEVITSNGVELYENENLLVAENGVYRISCGRDNEKNYLNLKAVFNGKQTNLAIYLGGMQKIYTADSFKDTDFTGTFTSAYLNKNTYAFNFDGTQANKITLNHACLNDLSKETQSLVFKMANDTQCQFKVFATFADYGRVEFQSGTLEANGEIVLNTFSSVNWERNGALVGLEIQIVGANHVGISQIIVSGN